MAGPGVLAKGLGLTNSRAVLPAALLMLAWTCTASAATPPGRIADLYPELRGRPVEEVRIIGNVRVPTAVIRNAIRIQVGDPFNPQVVEDDYRAIFALRRFSNVEAKVEPTPTGVIVAYVVTEPRQVASVAFRGNVSIDDLTLREAIDIAEGQAIDPFRIAIARQTIENLYRDRNFPLAEVEYDAEALADRGELFFDIVEGPRVRVRKVAFRGNESFSDERLRGQVRTRPWFLFFVPGTFDPDLIDEDVAALRRFYEGKGFFDARVGRRLSFSPDQRELQVTFLIEEGARYRINRMEFRGNVSVPETELRENLRLTENRFYDADMLQRDVRQIVRAYSPLGFIYYPPVPSPDYLQISTRTIFHREAGTLDLIYEISEGRSFRVGQILVKGNARTQDRVVLREMRIAPGEVYNAAEIADATDRLRVQPYFTHVTITPIGDDPNYRDLLVEVVEAPTAIFTVGAGINSNGGVAGNITYEQRNFDITNVPERFGDLFTDRAFVGAGQLFRITLEPGTRQTNASVRWTEPWLFDQPYSLTTEAYYRDRRRENHDEVRAGGRVAVGHRFDYIWSAHLTLRGENVRIRNIRGQDVLVDGESLRAPEILELKGNNTLESVGLLIRRDTTRGAFLPYEGTLTSAGWESFGLMGGDFTFQKLTASFDFFQWLYEDLLERRVIFALHLDAGYITGDAPFFERFYGGGLGSVRGFRFRGISPRAGAGLDPVGGEFAVTGSAEVSFPLAGESLRGVVFTDFGTVEEDVRIGRIRSSVGAGIRLTLPIFGQTPIALDFAWPLSKRDEDGTRMISFSLGFVP